MLTEPKTVNSTNYKLLPGKQYKTSRGGKVKACVLHVTAGAQDLGLSGSDPSAENTNKWVLSSGTTASWHRISDSDGVITCLPSWYTAYQAKGYNSSTVGNECCNVDARWDNKPKTWVKWTLWYYALSYADYVVKYKIPLRRATKAELDRAISSGGAPVGFIDHSRLSDNRSDPGKTFPWTQFFGYITAIIAGATSPDKPVTPPQPPRTPPPPHAGLQRPARARGRRRHHHVRRLPDALDRRVDAVGADQGVHQGPDRQGPHPDQGQRPQRGGAGLGRPVAQPELPDPVRGQDRHGGLGHGRSHDPARPGHRQHRAGACR
jgi:hypothetical protein